MDPAWRGTLDYLKQRIATVDFDTWILPIDFRITDRNQGLLTVNDREARDKIVTSYLAIIHDGLLLETGNKFKLEVLVDEQDEKAAPAIVREDESFPPPPLFRGVDRYTFSTFVVGPSNQFAHAACYNVANTPGHNYNPLFIYGGVGLGKTHLLNAIGHSILDEHPDWQIYYLSSEQFMNELIQALQFERMFEFRQRYRENCDAILMDDIQFIAGKDRTQEEFFHTFNTLYEDGKQIVVTSDMFPQEIPDLEERLRSRFQWGLVADIKAPEMETRVAILRKKAETDGVPLPDEVAMYIALHVKSNVRELEGCLTRLAAYARMTDAPINRNLAREVLRGLVTDKKPRITVEQIQKAVCSFYNVRISELKSNRRTKQIVLPRQVAMYICRRQTAASFPEIGGKFGGRDHTTVIFGVRRIEQALETDSDLRDAIETIESSLGSQ